MKRKLVMISALAAAAALLLTGCGRGLPNGPGAPGGPGGPGGPVACIGSSSDALEQVAVDAEGITVSGTVAAPCPSTVRLYALDPTADPGDLAGATPVATVVPAADGAFEAGFDRFDGDRDRLYSQIVAVGEDSGGVRVIGEPHYADQLALEPENSAPRFESTTQKGLAVTMTSDAEAVGVGHAAVSVGVNYLLKAGPGEPGETVEFESNGKTYYFDAKYIDWLDHTIKPLSDDDILVYLVLVIVYDEDENSSFPILVHPDAPTGPPASFMTYAFNTVTQEGIEHYTALMEFIAERYTRDDEQFGRSMDYIVGNEIDSAGVWQQMGEKTLPEFIDAYTPALRIGWQAAQRAHADARVYTSLDHFWNSTANPADPLRFYKGKDVLDALAAKVRTGGDFPWQLAYHPYPADMLNPDTWNDPVTDDPSSPKITFKNIAQLPAYLDQPSLHFDGEPRGIILSEQGCQSPSNSAADQARQAACFAYSYYKILAAGGIDAYIWDPQVDNRDAGGLRIGLWTWDEDRPDFPASPGEKKQVYDLFRDIDTPDSLALTEFAKPIIGIDEWTDAIPNFDPAMIDRRTETQQVGTRIGATTTGTTTISGFESGEDGWRTADHSNEIEAVATGDAPEGGSVLEVRFDDDDVVYSNGTNTKTWRGADVPFATPLDAGAAPVLGVQLRVPDGIAADFSPDNRFSAQIRAYGADGTVAFGTASIDPEAGWNAVQLDLSAWSGRDAIERVKVWMKGSSGEDWLGSFQLDDLSLSATASGGTPNLELTASAPDREGTGTPVTITVVNHGAETLAADLVVDACAGVELADPALPVTGLAGAGAALTLSSAFGAYEPNDPDHPTVCLSLGGATFELVVDVPPPPPTLLYDFEDGTTQGWTAGANVTSVATVSSFPNGPQVPHGGTGALEAIMADGDASESKVVSVRPAAPLPLGSATELYAWVDAYGGIPGASGYEATMTVHSGSETISVVEDEFRPDSWNRLSIDVSDWEHRDAVTGIDISYRALGTSHNWVGGPRLQVDDVGVEGDFDDDAAWRAAWTASIGGHFGGDSRADSTYRQSVTVAATGSAVRVRLSNPSSQPLTFDAASIGVRDGSTAAILGAPVPLTVGGDRAFTIAAGESRYSDPVALDVTAGDRLLVSTHAEAVLPLLSHDFALTTQFATAAGAGDRTADAAGTPFEPVGTSTYWIDAVDVFSSDEVGTVVILGDSITDGAGADVDADNRWPDRLAERFQTRPSGERKAVVNAGIGGNTLSAVGNPQVGDNGLIRLDRDALEQTGVTDVVVLAGTNDLYVGSSAEQVVYALTKAAQRIHDAGLRAVVSTLIPRGNGIGWTPALEAERIEVNAWIRDQGVFDAVIDLETAVADPAQPDVILAAYDADGTHPNAAGYQAMADAVDLAVFDAPRGTPSERLEVIADFEKGTDGWVPGTGVDTVSRVTSFPNGPQIPLEGRGALNGAISSASAGTPKTVAVEPDGALDLAGASEVYAWVDAYGGLPDAAGYAADITLYSGTESITGTNTSFGHDRWNRVAVDVAGWEHLDSVTRIEVTYRVVGSTTPWTGAQLQVDEVGAVLPVEPPAETVSLFDFEDGVAGWQADANVLGVSTVNWFPNGPHLPYQGTWALQAVMAEGDVSQPKRVSHVPASPIDLGDASEVALWFDGYGGVPDATGYAVDLTLWSGTTSVTGTLDGYQSDRWSRVSVGVADWAGRSAVDRIDVTYRILGSTFSWVGQPLFQIDDVHLLR